MRHVSRLITLAGIAGPVIKKEVRRRLEVTNKAVSIFVDGAFWAGIAEAEYQEELRQKSNSERGNHTGTPES